MKLVGRKTRKAIEKSVKKALKRHGPAIVAALAGGLASAIATSASTETPGKRGKSNLADVVDRATAAITGTKDKKSSRRPARRESRQAPSHDMEDTRSADDPKPQPH